jgi:hypothetical protein
MSRAVTDEMTPPSPAGAVAPPPRGEFGGDTELLDRLFPVVFGDAAIRDHLLEAHDREEFCRRLAGTAAAHGIELSPGRVGELLDDAGRRWIERWL